MTEEDLRRRVLSQLQQLHQAQPEVAQALIDHRVRVQPGSLEDCPVVALVEDGKCTLGLLGVLNGLITAAPIAAVYDEDGEIIAFE